MKKDNQLEIRKGRKCIVQLHAHLVFLTKLRTKVFDNEILSRLEEVIKEVCEDFEVELKEFNGKSDAIHFLIEYPPKVQLSKLINSLKGVSSRRLNKEFSSIRRCLYNGSLWSPSYFLGSCDADTLKSIPKHISDRLEL